MLVFLPNRRYSVLHICHHMCMHNMPEHERECILHKHHELMGMHGQECDRVWPTPDGTGRSIMLSHTSGEDALLKGDIEVRYERNALHNEEKNGEELFFIVDKLHFSHLHIFATSMPWPQRPRTAPCASLSGRCAETFPDSK